MAKEVIKHEPFMAMMSEQDKDLLRDLIASKARLREILPDNLSQDNLGALLVAMRKSLSGVNLALNRLYPLLGRMLELLAIEENQGLLKELGYSTYDDFMSRGMDEMFGISRNHAYNLRRISEEFRNDSIEILAEIGVAKSGLVATAIRH